MWARPLNGDFVGLQHFVMEVHGRLIEMNKLDHGFSAVLTDRIANERNRFGMERFGGSLRTTKSLAEVMEVGEIPSRF